MPYLNSPINKKSYYSKKKPSLRCVCNKLEIVMSGGDIAKTDGFLLWEDGLREPGTGGCLSAATLSWLFLWLLVLPVQSFFIIIIPCLSWWPLLESPVTAQLQPDAHLKSTPAFQISLLIWFSILFVCSKDRAAVERFCFWGAKG